jgi:hypothetical protein
MYWQTLMNLRNIELHENPLRGSRVTRTHGQKCLAMPIKPIFATLLCDRTNKEVQRGDSVSMLVR